ncbi:glycosyltransferase [Photobacterium aphoticum]|uniref:Glycosyl transferase n=1 Tax=Photobacterium aphoticum TaxID=754436 RepID=A0A0J1GQZ9_9GAMM|nr:glycosyltransferase [Photobacterium aphoticum]KLV01839.1 glycosyl transferase [Photobacterium aphoticum]PSU60068.1 glycosyl transferase [Photobacterium aphoticum]GHA32926.1 glycosyl transferase [Photobacterium aphoticum]
MSPISIVIITLNEEKRIGRLLEDLSKQSHRDFEVIVVDSNSDDNTCLVAQGFEHALPALTVHKMQGRGTSLGRNTGAKLARHERLLFLDADVRLSPTFLTNALHELDSRKLDVAGAYMGAENLSMSYRLGYAAFNTGLFITSFFFPTAVGACLFSTRRVHEEIGGFDESIVLCEDCDYAKRAAQTWRWRMIPVSFWFDPRRLEQDGFLQMGMTYLKANVRRFFKGEMRNNEMEYKFGHYKDAQ